MTDIPDIYLAREFIAYRWHKTSPPPSKALVAVAQTLSEKLSMPPLCYAGDPPPRLIELNEAFINVYIKQFEQFWEMNILQPFHLTNHQFQLSFFGQVNMSIGLIDKLLFRLLEIPMPEIQQFPL
ncbi:MAG TPA: hypothetical protein DEG17_04370 [Cyanobacteria bacterium UBA11149]|nr:hypothetical protein [Cyanobacteria bacterium UBA11367]HBE59406.1 hypothetical protein [Cyanobacteria bacterium UBA11366]HBS68332.1 hypothetical protein [Cyanobacteria bacterium UBA11153]HBW88125.1 hypothetical protein [Cyanobacteria bacterium UBA11149]HCA97929.1 hypothetical protein [Cyanobacteria bacterium UBA9226]